MSEENHEIANEEEIAENIKSLVNAGKKTITVKHVFKDERTKQPPTDDDNHDATTEGDDEDVREQLRKREAQLAALALKEFEKKKEQVLSLVEPEKRESAEKFVGDDPEKLKFLMYQTGYSSEGDSDDGTEPVPPKGKSRGLGKSGTQAPDTNRNYANPTINMISELFGILQDPEKTEKEKAIANQKLDSLYLEVAKGRKSNPNFKTIRGSITTCPSCGLAIENVDLEAGEECPHCGWKRDGAKTRKIRYDYTMKPK